MAESAQTPDRAPDGGSYLRDPDVQLMLRVRDGDEAAFGRLVAGYQDRLVGLLTHLIGERDAAEDLAQEAFLRVYRARKGYVPTAKFSTWLFRIAQNLASNSRRGRRRRREVPFAGSTENSDSRPQEALVAEKSAFLPNRQLAKREIQSVVRTALDDLGERQKLAVLLHRFEGMSYADIAETMEMTPQAVKSLLSRARESLRAKLEGYVK
ncbi:MAG: sigma-70 family RNA polymerase sigma factor [Planctomycetaceae bacterium]